MKLFQTNRAFKIRAIILGSALIASIFCGFIGFKFFRIDGDSMSPSYESRDKIVVNKIKYKFSEPERFDVIAFWNSDFEDFFIKRIVGMPRDTVEIKGGYIYINDIKLQDEFGHVRISVMLVHSDGEPMRYWDGPDAGEIVYEYVDEAPITLSSDEYWVIGDNRDVSWYGVAYINEIVGKII